MKTGTSTDSLQDQDSSKLKGVPRKLSILENTGSKVLEHNLATVEALTIRKYYASGPKNYILFEALATFSSLEILS